ncbi:hypothetical protein EU534_01205 [Candidatus Heimdallarchaeota archaeon]|nr:MAG: hypothetical protein EU534_01205 [Candidatus Heimdallarchaeota archaeon]
MSPDTFFSYLTNEEIQSTLSTTAKNKTKEQLQKLFFKELEAKKITSTKARNLWLKAIKRFYFAEFQRYHYFTPSDKFDTSTKLRNTMHKSATTEAGEQELEISSASILKLNDKPLHLLYTIALKAKTDFKAMMKLPLDSLIFISVFPKLGIVSYWPTTKDKKSKFVLQILKDTFKGLNEIKVNALLLRRYAVNENITKLGISTPQEIAGFAGLDVIEFRGSNVMLGLSGLKRRHDANVDVITRVGPFTEIESDIIRLICGTGINIKTYEGLEALLRTLKSK